MKKRGKDLYRKVRRAERIAIRDAEEGYQVARSYGVKVRRKVAIRANVRKANFQARKLVGKILRDLL